MKLQYDFSEAQKPGGGSGNVWYAQTDNRDLDSAGRTPIDAVSALAESLENELYEANEELRQWREGIRRL